MRKDVKLGLAVGGVLLAVLVVYVLVVPGNNVNQTTAVLEPIDGSDGQPSGGTGGSPDALASRDDATGSQQRQGAAGGAQDQRANASGAPANARTGGPGASSSSAGGGAESANSQTAGGGWNWDALVNGTEKLPSLGASTDVRTGHAGAAGNTSGSLAAGSLDSGAASAGNPHDTPSNGSTGSGTSAAGNVTGAVGNGTTAANGTPTAQGSASNQLATAAGPAQSPARQGALGGSGQAANAIAPTTPASASGGAYVVKDGDTYSKISQSAYGSSKYYAQIEAANPGVDPTRLKPGMTINLPAIEQVKPAGSAAVANQQTIDPQKEYKVQPNDSLYTISLRLYGKADRVEKLYELNKATIGDDMSRVKVGMILKLPEPPTQGRSGDPAPQSTAAAGR